MTMKKQIWSKHTLSLVLVLSLALSMGIVNVSAAKGDAVTINNSGATTGLDKSNLKDGVYSVNVDMIKLDRASKSMSDNAINHTVKLEVRNGEYFVTLDFKGLTIGDSFGYLSKLSYYDEGYTYGQYGAPEGKLVLAEVLSTQKNSDGTDVIDQYNDADSLYPDLLKIKVVSTAMADEDGYVPLHVFVPIMDAISSGSGDQDVLMKIDWTMLKEITGEEPSPEVKKGDVDGNGSVDLADAQMVLKAALGIITL